MKQLQERKKQNKEFPVMISMQALHYSNILFTITPLPSLWQPSVWWATPVFVWREVWATGVLLAGLREKEYQREQKFCQKKNSKEIVQNDEEDTLDEKKQRQDLR